MGTQGQNDSSRQPTVKEVALLAGVSPMTVSRTLNGGKSVRLEVQQRVIDAVQMLGYQRNENARSIRPGQPSGLVGVAITNIANPYYGNFALGVEDIASQRGRRIILGTTGEDSARERQLIADFIGRQVEGLILVPSGGRSDHLQPNRLRGTPLVLASRMAAGVDVDAVIVDDIGGALRGTQALLDVGHTRIGYLGNDASTFTGMRRFQGFRQALVAAGLAADPRHVRLGQNDISEAALAATDVLMSPDAPTALFAANNRNAVGALKAIGELLAHGRPLETMPALVSFDSFELSELMPVPVVVVDHDARELGRQAATMLFRRLDGDPDAPAVVVEMPTVVRNSRR
ncbi:LacI family transcriptional regulator [Cryobacterium sp. MP_M5]|uniref:LacI family DNA-binding transcriptional regulator n=1 Tax=unclassified Cryobacterium TaxID=2649013 RepID=UPI0018C93358|nr:MULTISPECIES: LacI family DNA-binding transcriptional regulator [unclassified Cryobacterium]MBG6057212.1 LacI family transcriptional regulator [Cryobacterium sp. MP_M3]MEC5175411.1 LacI family transcriptional regulator [Cryobacterium sp. MP_M5]